MKALLINPPTGLYIREDRCQSSVADFIVSVNRPPMDLMMMASSLESIGWECKIKDYPIEKGPWAVFKEDFAAFLPDLLILSITTPTLKNDMISCGIAKKFNPKVLTIAKGAHFLRNDAKSLEEFKDLDIVIRGESELVIKEIALNNNLNAVKGITYRIDGQLRRNDDRLLLENLDELPLPARHLVNNNSYVRPDTGEPMAIIETSRGCPANCIFCLTAEVAGKKVRNRSPEAIVNEIRECVEKYHIHNFHFKADTFTWNKDWVLRLCGKINECGLNIKWLCNSRADTLDKERILSMKKAGCWAIGLGAESGNQAILDKIKKGITLESVEKAVDLCREFKITSYLYFMIGFPWDNKDTVNETINFALKTNPDFVDFFFPYPFPGTELEKIVRENKLLDAASGSRAYSEATMGTIFLSKRELFDLRKKALQRFYMRPAYILKRLSEAKSLRILGNYIHYGVKTFRKIG